VALTPEGLVSEVSGTVERAVAYAKKASSGFSWFVSPVMALARAGIAIGESMGFSRPVLGIATRMGMVRTELALASGSAGSGSTIGMDPAASRSIEGAIPGQVAGETRVQTIASKWGALSTYFATSTLMVIHPNNYARSGTSPNQLILMTPCGFATSFFRYWRGTITVRMTWYSTPLVRGLARVTLIPPGGNLAPSNLYSGRFYMVDVVGTTSYEFEVPYEYSTRYAAVVAPNAVLTGVAYPNITWSWEVTPKDSTGASLSIIPTLEICIKDLVCDVPNLQTIATSTGQYAHLEGAQTGEDTDDLLLLTRRGSFMCTAAQTAGPDITYMVLPADPILGDLIAPIGANTLTISRTAPTFVTWLKSAYFGWTGGIVWTIVSDSTTVDNDRVSVWEVQNLAAGCYVDPVAGGAASAASWSVGGINPPVVSTSGLAFLESNTTRTITIPDRSLGRFRYGARSNVVSVGYCTSNVALYGPLTNVANYNIYIAGSEDFVVGWFLCAPVLIG
jgi:hypothetical protein